MKIKDLYNFLNNLAPFSLQEKWDNSGLITGDFDREIDKILISVELTEKVLEECIKGKFDTIITHHPAIFGSVKKINSKETPIIFKALQNNINILSMHTNFDVSFRESFYPAGLENITAGKDILSVTETEKLYKIVIYAPEEYSEKVRNAMFESGAGHIGNYSCCSFNNTGTGTFKPEENTQPFIGNTGVLEKVSEVRIESVISEKNINKVLSSVKKVHPYEEIAYDLFPVKLKGESSGFGIKATLKKSYRLIDIINILKVEFPDLRASGDKDTVIKKIAFCNGSGISLIGSVYGKADVYITGDVKYHDACEALKRHLPIIDIGHFESENIFKKVIFDRLKENKLTEGIILEISSEDLPVFWGA